MIYERMNHLKIHLENTIIDILTFSDDNSLLDEQALLQFSTLGRLCQSPAPGLGRLTMSMDALGNSVGTCMAPTFCYGRW